MKTTYELTPADLKVAIEAWMSVRGTPVTDADTFTVGPDGTVTIEVTSSAALPVIYGPRVVVAPVPPPSPVVAPPVANVGFERAFAFVLKWEGSDYEDVSGDPGGPTKFGIDAKDHPSVDIKGLTLGTAKQIYLTDYWQASNCDHLPSPVAETHFNYSVNVGREESIRFMQRALGVTADGEFGALTASALAAANPKVVALGMVAQADGFYKDLAGKGQFAKFLTGWLNRNNDLRTFIG